jgi:hypothetical protein
LLIALPFSAGHFRYQPIAYLHPKDEKPQLPHGVINDINELSLVKLFFSQAPSPSVEWWRGMADVAHRLHGIMTHRGPLYTHAPCQVW